MESNPFAGLEDQTPLGPQEALGQLLASAKRGYVPIRNDFVQRTQEHGVRASVLAQFVTNRQERALDAFLTLHALQPVLSDSPLPLGAWANILSTRKPCAPTTVSKTFRTLEAMKLVSRSRERHSSVVTPLYEDGGGQPWFRPGSRAPEVVDNYFTVPHEYWTAGYIDRLHLPGKAMLLIMLKETQGKPAFDMAVERAYRYYGISERTAERGYGELGRENLLNIHIQRLTSPRLPPNVFRDKYWRALKTPFSTDARSALQVAARATSVEGESRGTTEADPSVGGV